MRAFFVAAVPLTAWRRLFGLLLSSAARSDAIEIFGIKSHDGANYGAADERQQELTNRNVTGLVGTFFANSEDPVMTLQTSIEEKLRATFAPERLSVINESHLQRHRVITDLLKPELDAGLHALAIEPAAPGEPTRW
jgi:BolA protein